MMDDPNITMEEYIKLQAEKLEGVERRLIGKLLYTVEGYIEENVQDFEQRLDMIFGRQVNRVHVLDFAGLTKEMRETLTNRMRDTELRLDEADTLCLHSIEEMVEDRFEAYWVGSTRVILDKGDLGDYWTAISSDRDFLGDAPTYTYIKDPVRRLFHRLISCIISGRGQVPKKVTATDLFYMRSMEQGTANVLYLAAYFGLVSDVGLIGLTVIAREPPMIDIIELVKLNICVRLDETWAWVAPGPEGQPVDVTGSLEVAEGAPNVDEDRLSRLEEEVHSLRGDMGEQREVLDSMIHDFARFTTWTRRRVRQRTGEASTSATPLDEDQPDP
ncbi:hypothetical protein Tco_1089498 [Tanacetum coccineum]